MRDADAVARALVGVDAVCHQVAKVGLGLDPGEAPDGPAIVRGIVEAQAGRVAVAKTGTGCRFEVRLPTG
ncbi:hypothetical protein [Embleya sp. NPDC020630]|uniref:hypothetical protein n=1 Tax=Embleya sp. NPDC020630 TaxID=3363979 RepID=UPI0037A8E881